MLQLKPRLQRTIFILALCLFTISDTLPSLCTDSAATDTGTGANSSVACVISINVAKKKPVNPLVFGQNSLAYDPCSYAPNACRNSGTYSNSGSGQWDPKSKRPNDELAALASRIRTSVLRFPGGCGAHRYNWKSAIGPLENRPMFQFGLDEFLQLCESIGAEPIITLSYFAGDQDLADLIAYLNLPVGATNANAGTDWAKVRAQNGHPNPYHVRLFEFDNEIWHGDHVRIRSVDSYSYASRFVTCREKLRTVDPNMQLGIVLHDWAASEPGMWAWDRAVLAIAGNSCDFGIIHSYPVDYGPTSPVMPPEGLFKIAFAAPDQFKIGLESISQQITEVLGRELPLAITEFNGGFYQDKPVPYRHSLGNALFIADMLRVLLTTDAPILCANYWQFSNSYWGLVAKSQSPADAGSYFKRPTYLAFELLTSHIGTQLLDIRTLCPSYSSDAFGNVEATVSDAPASPPWIITGLPLHAASWEDSQVSGVQVNRDNDILSVSFLNPGDVNYYHTGITPPVDPSHRYRLSVQARTENFTPQPGIGLSVTDARRLTNTTWEKETGRLWGSTNWNLLGVEFQPLPDAKSVRIWLKRVQGDGAVSGKILLKNALLEDLGPAVPYAPTPYLSALASTDDKGTKIHLLVINKDLTRKLKTAIRMNGFLPAPSIPYWVLNGNTIDATNENATGNVNVMQDRMECAAGSQRCDFAFEPHSITAIEFSRDSVAP